MTDKEIAAWTDFTHGKVQQFAATVETWKSTLGDKITGPKLQDVRNLLQEFPRDLRKIYNLQEIVTKFATLERMPRQQNSQEIFTKIANALEAGDTFFSSQSMPAAAAAQEKDEKDKDHAGSKKETKTKDD